MFERIWHWKGTVSVTTTASSADAIERIGASLERQRKWITTRTDETIEFDGSLLNETFPPHMRALLAVNKGRFTVEEIGGSLEVSYDFEGLHMLIFATISSVMFFLVISNNEGLVRGITVGFLALAWIYGGSWVIAKARIPALIIKTVS